MADNFFSMFDKKSPRMEFKPSDLGTSSRDNPSANDMRSKLDALRAQGRVNQARWKPEADNKKSAVPEKKSLQTKSPQSNALYRGSTSNSVERKKILERILKDEKTVSALGLKGFSRESKIREAQVFAGGIDGYQSRERTSKINKALESGNIAEIKKLIPNISDKTLSRLHEPKYRRTLSDTFKRMMN